MVQPRSATDRIASGQVYDKDRALAQENTLELLPAGAAASPPKKRRRDATEAPKKRRRGEQGGLCRLNLDELYIVRGLPFVML